MKNDMNPAIAAVMHAPEPTTNSKPKPTPRSTVPPLTAVDGLAVYRSQADQTVCIVDDLLWRGVTIFAGRPKVGKSWAMLQLAIAVATGQPFLGKLRVLKQGGVVYCALEEPQRRTTARMRKLTDDVVQLQNLQFIYRVRPLLNGGAAQLDQFLGCLAG